MSADRKIFSRECDARGSTQHKLFGGKTMANAKRDGAAPEEVRDLRHAIDWMKKEGDIIITDKEVDPNLEITGIQKQLDGGCPILFNNIKGKPNHRCITNLFGDMNVINKMFGWKDHADRT